MSNLDQFESTFNSAVKQNYTYTPINCDSILILTDLEEQDAQTYIQNITPLIQALSDNPNITALHKSHNQSLANIIDHIKETKPQIIITYRNLNSNVTTFPYTLGAYLDVLTQATTQPILVTPRPQSITAPLPAPQNTLVITNHLTGDDRLVNYAITAATKNANIFLAHIEDDSVFKQYINTIKKIPTIDTEEAQNTISNQLLKEPSQYIQSCQQTLNQINPNITCHPIVKLGHTVDTFLQIAKEHQANLIVMNTKDQDQLAMHGLAYPLAIALRNIPLLML